MKIGLQNPALELVDFFNNKVKIQTEIEVFLDCTQNGKNKSYVIRVVGPNGITLTFPLDLNKYTLQHTLKFPDIDKLLAEEDKKGLLKNFKKINAPSTNKQTLS